MRKKNETKPFQKNTTAAMWIPIRLLISIVIISFITGLIVIGSQLTTQTVEHNELKNKLVEIRLSLESLYQYGECRSLLKSLNIAGSTRVFELQIPDTISSVHFGKKHGESNGLSSSIRYESKEGIHTIWLDSDIQLVSAIEFKNTWQPNEFHDGFTLQSGINHFTAELVCNARNQFILLYSNK